MARQNQQILAFNRGIISALGLARTDVARIPWSADTQTNWMLRLLGSMMLRPGLKYTGGSHSNNAAIHIPFVFAKSDTAIIEISDLIVRVKIDETPITRPSVSSAITNGTFDSNINNWTDNDEAGATSSWATGGYAQLLGDGTNAARLTQQITVAGGDQNVEHALRVVIQRGPVTFKVGSSSGTDEYVAEAILGTGTHSLAFTPSGNFFIDISSRLSRAVLVDSISIEASGIMTLPAPWTETDLPYIRSDQSADIIYIACKDFQQRKIERRGSGRSWSIVKYEPTDGPFRKSNLTQISLTPSALNGNITLTASKAYFKSTNVGSLFKLVSNGQNVSSSISAQNTFSNSIEVTGVLTGRDISITITGTFTATITLQRSFDGGTSWADVSTWTSPLAPTIYNDGLSNQTVEYRIGIKTGNYSSGTATVSLDYSAGSITGYARVTAYTNEAVVSAEVLKDFGKATATTNWAEGEWSDRRGWPSGVALTEGRLFWAGKSKIIGSISDGYESFDDSIEGESGLVSRGLGAGPIDDINWLLALHRLFVGTDSSEKAVKTTSLEEPITPTNFKVVDVSTQGSDNVNPARLDRKGLFVQAGGTRLFELDYDSNSLDYVSTELTELAPEIGQPAIVRVAVQRQPDTRIHCVRSDGIVAVLVYQPTENLKGWVLVETDGDVEDAFVLPGDVEDTVYYLVKRTINGSTVRYLEKWALESECQGGTLNKQADSFLLYSGASTTTITGLSHLEGESVVVWGNGADLGSYTVTSGQITGLTSAVTSAVIGLPYTAQYKSTKLAYAAVGGSALNQKKIINGLGVILYNTHYQGLQYGPDFDNLDNLPLVDNGKITTVGTIHSSYDKDMFEFEGVWDTDSRICLQASAPRPCTALGITFQIETNEKG